MFSTPRKLDVDDFASSSGETPKSPERNDVDSDATPDMNLRSKFASLDTMTKPSLPHAKTAPVFTAGGKKEKDKESPSRRQSWWRGLSNIGSSPRSSKDDYAHGAERRIMKRRTKEQKALVPRRDSVSDSEPEQRQVSRSRKVSGKQDKNQIEKQTQDVPQPPPPPPQEVKKPHWTFTFFEFLTAHPTLPHILSFYAQLVLNMFLISGVMYIVYSFWSTIRSDVDKKASIAASEIAAEMMVCLKQYNENRCAPETRTAYMEAMCQIWEKCMNQKPENVGRARVSAHAFAEIFNSFIEPISYKAMVSLSALSAPPNLHI